MGGMGLRAALVAAALAGCMALGACGDDDDDGGGSDSNESTELNVTAAKKGSDYTLDMPKTVSGGAVKVTFENTDPKYQREVQLVRVDGKQSAADVLKVVGAEAGKIPPWFHAAGGVGSTDAGQTAEATVDLETGRHFAIDTNEPEGDDVKSFAEQGAVSEFEVKDGSGDELPSADAEIKMIEYGFETSGLKAGKNTFVLDNAGKELHHTIAFPFAKGATLAEVQKALTSEAETQGPPPVDFEAGSATAVLDGGAKQVASLELKKGKYAFVCFVTDRAGGPPHVAKGMIRQVDVN